MSGVRRSRLAVEAEGHVRETRALLGAQVRSARLRRAWTQEQLAARAGIGRLVVGRIERGDGRLDLDLVQRVALALNLQLTVALARDREELPSDAGHLLIQELVLQLARVAGINGSFEVATRPAEPWRSIDIGLAASQHRAFIVAECWNTIGDIGAAARVSSRKRAEAEAAAVARWGPEGRAGLVWIVRATARNRRLLDRYPEIFASRFPGSSRQWVSALTRGAAPPTEDGLVWCDVNGTRIFEWRR